MKTGASIGIEGFSATYTENMDFSAHWHKEIELMYVLEGRIGIGLNKEYNVLEPGDLSICESNGIHYYSSKGFSSKAIMIIFSPELLMFKELETKKIKIQPAFIKCMKDERQRRRIDAIIKDIAQEYFDKDTFHSTLLNLKLSELFLNLFRCDEKYYLACVSSKDKDYDYSRIPMQKALKYLEDNYSEEITLESLSEEAGLSPFYFSRLFKNTTGTNYNSYLAQLRINNAEHLIKTTSEHIIDIAYKTGFKSIRTFNRTFKNLRGYTPQDVRK